MISTAELNYIQDNSWKYVCTTSLFLAALKDYIKKQGFEFNTKLDIEKESHITFRQKFLILSSK